METNNDLETLNSLSISIDKKSKLDVPDSSVIQDKIGAYVESEFKIKARNTNIGANARLPEPVWENRALHSWINDISREIHIFLVKQKREEIIAKLLGKLDE